MGRIEEQPTERFIGSHKKVYSFPTFEMHVPAHYTVQGHLGSGVYGLVCAAVDGRNGVDSYPVAIKKIRNVFETVGDAKRILREMEMLHFCRHRNLLSLKDVFWPCLDDESATTDIQTVDEVYVVTEAMEYDLKYLISETNICDRENVDYHNYLVHQMLCGLQYLHSAGVVHRDIKPGNILVSPSAEGETRLCDFGLARTCSEDMTGYVVTRWYRAPELLLACKTYDASVDMWAIGCIAAELFLRKPLFAGKDYIDQITLIVKLLGLPDLNEMPPLSNASAGTFLRTLPPPQKDSIGATLPGSSEKLIQFLEGTLTYNPKKRLTPAEALKLPLFEDYLEPEITLPCEKKFEWEGEQKEWTEAALRDAMNNLVKKVQNERVKGLP